MPNLQTVTDLINRETDNLQDFYRALPKRYQFYYKRLIKYINNHVQAIRVAKTALPLELFLLTIALEQEKAIYLLQDDVDCLKKKVEELQKAS